MNDPIRAAEAAQTMMNWTDAPNRTQWGAGMMEALLPLGKDHTLRLYAEREALHLVPAALRAALPGLREVPAGWKLVPSEADLRMVVAGGVALTDASDRDLEATVSELKACYAAMLAAAPSAAGLREAGEPVAKFSAFSSDWQYSITLLPGVPMLRDGTLLYAAPPSPAPQGERAEATTKCRECANLGGHMPSGHRLCTDRLSPREATSDDSDACGRFAQTTEPAPEAGVVEALREDQIDSLRGLDTDKRVRFYEHDFYVLSNFSAFSLQWKGLRFDTSEAAYHWEKFEPHYTALRNAIQTAPSAHEAFKLAERNKHCRRADWDAVKVEIMRDILRAKAAQHEYVRRKLLATADRELVEDSWRDDFWGWGPNRHGQNMLGNLWMEVRAELRAALAAQTANNLRGTE